jgi:hypothetical protein
VSEIENSVSAIEDQSYREVLQKQKHRRRIRAAPAKFYGKSRRNVRLASQLALAGEWRVPVVTPRYGDAV